jgi:hypothetical protein
VLRSDSDWGDGGDTRERAACSARYCRGRV